MMRCTIPRPFALVFRLALLSATLILAESITGTCRNESEALNRINSTLTTFVEQVIQDPYAAGLASFDTSCPFEAGGTCTVDDTVYSSRLKKVCIDSGGQLITVDVSIVCPLVIGGATTAKIYNTADCMGKSCNVTAFDLNSGDLYVPHKFIVLYLTNVSSNVFQEVSFDSCNYTFANVSGSTVSGGVNATSVPTTASSGANVTAAPTAVSGGANATAVPTAVSGGANATAAPTTASGGTNATVAPTAASGGANATVAPTTASGGTNATVAPTTARGGTNATAAPTTVKGETRPTAAPTTESGGPFPTALSTSGDGVQPPIGIWGMVASVIITTVFTVM